MAGFLFEAAKDFTAPCGVLLLFVSIVISFVFSHARRLCGSPRNSSFEMECIHYFLLDSPLNS